MRYFVDGLLTSNKVIFRMKTLFLFFFILWLTNEKLHAQSELHFNQLVFNQAIINPGFAGSNKDGLFDIVAFNRNQMSGFEGAPVTTAVNVSGPLDIGGVNSGVSLSFYNDKAGYLSIPAFNLGYAYRFKVLKGSMGVGVSLGMLISSLDPEGGWRLPDGSNNDNAIPTQKASKTSFDAGLGAYYSDDDWYAGISCMHITQPTIAEAEKSSKMKPSFYFSAGYNYTLPSNSKIELKPSVFISTDWATTLYSVNAQIMFKKKYWAGINYRIKSSVGAMVGLNLFSTLKVGYAYDYSTTAISKYGSSSHELMLSYSFSLIKNKGKQKFKSIRYL